jgi:hypothetical protein
LTDPEPTTGGGKALGAIAGAVVRHHGGDPYAQTPQPAYGPREEAGRRAATFVGEHLAETDTRMIVDRHVSELPPARYRADPR